MEYESNVFWDFRVYVPEQLAFRQKDSPTCRRLLEDLAVLDRNGRCVLASRGKRFEASLPDLCFSARSGRRLIADGEGCFLLFPDLCPDEGLTLAVYFERSPFDLSLALSALGRKDFEGLFGGGKPDQALFDLLAELLFYLDSLLLHKESLPLWTLVLRAANFAGCKLKRACLPMQSFRPDPADNALFLAFLLCFFLSVRRAGGEAMAEADRSEAPLRVRISAQKEERESPLCEVAPFLDCDGFRRFRLLRDGSKNAVLLPLQRRIPRVSSGTRATYFCVLLECDDAEE